MSFGFWEIAVVLLVVVVFFGAGKLPAAMGDFAKGIKAFKSGMKDETETAEAAPAAAAASQPTAEAVRPAAPLLLEPAAQPDEARRA